MDSECALSAVVFASFHPRPVSPYVSFINFHSRGELALVLFCSAQVLSHASTATRCDLRDPGWGDPGFPQRGLLLPHLRMAIFDVLLVVVFQMACVDNSTKEAILIHQEHLTVQLPCFVVVLFFCLFCLCLLFFVVCVFGFAWFPVFVVCLRQLDS